MLPVPSHLGLQENEQLDCMDKIGLDSVKVAESAPLCCHLIWRLTLACSLQCRVCGADGKHAEEVVADGNRGKALC